DKNATMNEELRLDHDSVRLYLRQIGRVALLTREGEIELAKRIELGEHAILRGILLCPQGVDQLGRLRQRLVTGEATPRDVLRNVDEEEPNWLDREKERLLKLATTVLRS